MKLITFIKTLLKVPKVVDTIETIPEVVEQTLPPETVKKVKSKVPIVVTIIVIIAALSITLNVLIIKRYIDIKHEVKDVVTENIDKVKEEVETKTEEINKDFDNVITDVKESLENADTLIQDTVVKVDEKTKDEYVKIKVDDVHYTIKLANDLPTSHKQTTFVADKLNYVTDQFEQSNAKYNSMISDLQLQLDGTKQQLVQDLSSEKMNELVNNTVDKWFRFGIDVYASTMYPINQIKEGTVPVYGRIGAGIGLNLLLKDQILIRGSIGVQQIDTKSFAPQASISVGWFF